MKPTTTLVSLTTEQSRRLQIPLDAPSKYEPVAGSETYTFGDRKDVGRMSLGHGAFKTRKLGG